MDDIDKILKNIYKVLKSEKFAVMSSSNGKAIHSNLVAFVFHKQENKLFFCTTKSTRKYENLNTNNNITLLIHNCTNNISDIKEAYSLCLKGYSKELDDIPNDLNKLYLKKHPYLKTLIQSPTSAFFEVSIHNIDLVNHFQEVKSIKMSDDENL